MGRNLWDRQRNKFFDGATIDLDGVLIGTTCECKQGMSAPVDNLHSNWAYMVMTALA